MISWICDLTAKEYVDSASNHKDTSDVFLDQAARIMDQSPHEITTGCTGFGKLVKKRANSVLREIHLLSAYMRLKPYPEMVLVGNCSPEHNTCFAVAQSLARRFDRFLILVFTPENFSLTTQRTDLPKFPIITGSSEKEVIDKVRTFSFEFLDDYLPLDIILEEGDFLWEKYYETQFLEQRLNTRLFRKFIPKYAMEKANMKLEKGFYEKIIDKSKKNKKLDSFFRDI